MAHSRSPDGSIRPRSPVRYLLHHKLMYTAKMFTIVLPGVLSDSEKGAISKLVHLLSQFILTFS